MFKEDYERRSEEARKLASFPPPLIAEAIIVQQDDEGSVYPDNGVLFSKGEMYFSPVTRPGEIDIEDVAYVGKIDRWEVKPCGMYVTVADGRIYYLVGIDYPGFIDELSQSWGAL